MSEQSAEGIGTRLINARKACGMTTAAAAARLRCDEKLLLALEQERFEDIGAAVFVQGHLRRYAELLGIPSESLLASLAARQQEVIVPDLTRLPRPPVRNIDPRSWARLSSVVAASLVIAIAAWWILQGSGVTPPPPTVEVPAVQPQAVAAELPPAPVEATPVAVEPAPAVVEAPAAPPSATSLVLTTTEECWVEIYDERGRRVVFNMLRPGTPIRVSARAPLRMLLGRADAVTVEWAGRNLRVPSTLIRNSTARVVLAEDGSFSAAPRAPSPDTP